MRFLLFNAIVAGALIYLFSGGDLPGTAARQLVDAAMARLAALSERAADSVGEMTPAAEAPSAPAAIDTDAATPPLVPDRAVAEAEVETPAAPAPAAETVVTAPDPVPLPERQVEAVPAYRVPTSDASEPVAAPPMQAPIEISEPMMSSQDRRKELFSLAQEMELIYAKRVGQ